MGIRSRASGANSGDIKAFAGASIPAGWLVCGGQAVSRATYAALFLAIGTVYGAGDGSTTFNLPDMRGRTLFGKDDMNGSAANRLTSGVGGVDGVTLGASGGGQAVTLTTAQLAVHSHAGTLTAGQNGTGGASNFLSSGASTTGTQGSSSAHQNIPPAMVTNFIIKA